MLWLYFNKALIFFKMCTYISIYVFHIDVDIGNRERNGSIKGRLFCRMFELVRQIYWYKWLCIKLAQTSIGISFNQRLFGIENAYSHNVLFRLFVGLMEINPVFLLISLCISTSLVLGINSFYYDS